MNGRAPLPTKEEIAAFCSRNHIRKLSFFGSVLRDDFRPDSDIDILAEFAPGHTPGLEIIDIEEELSAILGGHKAHIANPKYLNRRLKHKVLATSPP